MTQRPAAVRPSDPLADLPRARASRGNRSTLTSQFVRVACKATGVIVLARLVTPAEHGVFAMAASVMFFLVLFRDCGLGTAAIQATTLSEEQCTALWRAHLALGLLLAGVSVVLAPVAAAFYQEPRVLPVLITMSGSFVLLGLGGWPRVLLAREIRFEEINRLETYAALAGTAAMIGSAAAGAGAYSFVVFLLVSEAVAVSAAWHYCRWRPGRHGAWRDLRQLWRTSVHISGYNILVYGQLQLDTLLAGHWFGAATLGPYNRASQLLLLPHQHVAAPLSQVALSALSRLGRTSRDFTRQLTETANLIAHLTLPIAAVCAALPQEIVRLVLGDAWPEAAPVLRWLSLQAVASYLTATFYALNVATGHTRRLVVVSAVGLGVTAIALWLGRNHGITGLATALGLANLGLLLPRLWWATLGTPVTMRDYAAALLGPVALGGAIALGAWGGRAWFADHAWGVRLLTGLTGGLLAAVVSVLASRRLRAEWRSIWAHRNPRVAAE